MTYEVKPSQEYQGDWIADAVNDEGDGEMYLVFFSGPNAKERAEEYADWKNREGVVECCDERRPAVAANV